MGNAEGAAKAVGPFNEADPPALKVLPASDQLKFLLRRESVEVHVEQRESTQILVYQGKGGTRYGILNQQSPGDSLGKGGLAGSQGALENDNGTRPKFRRKPLAKLDSGLSRRKVLGRQSKDPFLSRVWISAFNDLRIGING